MLTGFPGQADRLVKPGLGLGPPVRGRLIDRHVAQQEGQRAHRGCAARGLERAVGERPSGVRLAQPDRAHGGPGEQPGVVAEFVRALEHFDRRADRGRAGLVFTGEDQRHAPHDQREEGRPAAGVRRGERGGPPRGQQHGRGIAGVEGRVRRLGEHHDGTLRIERCRALGAGQEDLLRFGDRSAASGDVTPEMLDRDGQLGRGCVPAGLGEERDGTFGEPAEPGGVGRGVPQPARAGRPPRRQLRVFSGGSGGSSPLGPAGPRARTPGTRPRRRCAGRRAGRPAQAPTMPRRQGRTRPARDARPGGRPRCREGPWPGPGAVPAADRRERPRRRRTWRAGGGTRRGSPAR